MSSISITTKHRSVKHKMRHGQKQQVKEQVHFEKILTPFAINVAKKKKVKILTNINNNMNLHNTHQHMT